MQTYTRYSFCLLFLLGITSAVRAEEGDTTVVISFAQELQNINSRDVTENFIFPNPGISFNEIYMVYRLDCPGSPGDCDPWDRTAKLWLCGSLQIRP